MSVASAMRGAPVVLQNAATTGNGTTIAVPTSFKNHTLIIKGSAGVGAGAVQFEGSDDPLFAGTYFALGGGPVTVVASAELQVSVVGLYPFVRARISTNVTGGTVTCSYIGG